jgi:hypothetical protein
MGGLIPYFGVGAHRPLNLYLLAVVKLDVALIVGRQGRLVAQSPAEEGNQANGGQDYCPALFGEKEEQDKRGKPAEDDGKVRGKP